MLNQLLINRFFHSNPDQISVSHDKPRLRTVMPGGVIPETVTNQRYYELDSLRPV